VAEPQKSMGVGRVNSRFRFRYSFICHGTLAKRQRRDLCSLRVKLPV